MQSTLRRKDMSEKDKVLRQISEIQHHLVDKETFFPYNFNACHVWSLIAIVLTFVMIPSYEYSIMFGTGVNVLMMMTGFIIEGIMTKKVNESYDIEECTRRQQYIVKTFIIISLVLITFSAMLAFYKLYIPILLLWLSLISLGYLSISFVVNLKVYEYLAYANILVALIVMGIAMNFNFVQDRGAFLMVIQVILVLGLAVVPSWLAFKQNKFINHSTEACGV